MVDGVANPPRERDATLRTLTGISIAHWVSHFYILVPPMLFPFLKEQLGVGFVELGFAITVFAAVSGLTQAPIGYLVDRVGARLILLTGERLTAQEALRIGLVNEVVPVHEVLPRARAIADRIARNGPLAVRKIKETVLQSIGQSLVAAYAMEDAARLAILPTEDAIEGPKAFFAKREPTFTGR